MIFDFPNGTPSRSSRSFPLSGWWTKASWRYAFLTWRPKIPSPPGVQAWHQQAQPLRCWLWDLSRAWVWDVLDVQSSRLKMESEFHRHVDIVDSKRIRGVTPHVWGILTCHVSCHYWSIVRNPADQLSADMENLPVTYVLSTPTDVRWISLVINSMVATRPKCATQIETQVMEIRENGQPPILPAGPFLK